MLESAVAPVKGMALVHPEEISLEPFGVAANRRFFVVDECARRYGQIRNGTLVRIEPSYDEASGALSLSRTVSSSSPSRTDRMAIP